MEESYTLGQLLSVVGVVYVVYAVAYVLIFLFLDPAKPQEPQPVKTEKPAEVPQQPQKKKVQEKPKTQPADKKKPVKEKNLHKIVPLGKAAFCKFCEVYMDDDEFLKTHESGKKHQKNCKNSDVKWFHITEKPQEELKPLTSTAEEVEEGWTL